MWFQLLLLFCWNSPYGFINELTQLLRLRAHAYFVCKGVTEGAELFLKCMQKNGMQLVVVCTYNGIWKGCSSVLIYHCQKHHQCVNINWICNRSYVGKTKVKGVEKWFWHWKEWVKKEMVQVRTVESRALGCWFHCFTLRQIKMVSY